MCELDARSHEGGLRAGSRRRRIWELGSHSHCPVIGVCLPMAALRRLVNRTVGGTAVADDYELHCGVIAECRHRTPMAEAVQRELDRRYPITLRQGARAKTTQALAQWWRDTLGTNEVAGALWATLTHPRCDHPLEERVLQDIHMLQHQLGAATRVDLQRLNDLIDENAVLSRELGAAQQRCTRQADEHARKVAQLQADVVKLRAELIGRDTALAAVTDELRTLEASVPSLKSRVELGRQVERHIGRIHDLERALLQTQQDAERERARADLAEQALAERASLPAYGSEAPLAIPRLDDRAVLCVGGRQAIVPVYRKLIERVGARFLHHDGGAEDGTSELDATLASADLVICQTGCISHEAYWRVKDHCKRTGKRCVFVEKPSRASLQRALGALAGATCAPVVLVPATAKPE